MKPQGFKNRIKNRLNLRIRENSVRPDSKLHPRTALKLSSIRIVEDFDYNRLEEISSKVLEPASYEPNVYEPASEIWSIRSLDQGITALDETATEKAILAWCLNMLSRSPIARALIEESKRLGWKIGLDDLGSHDFHLDVPARTIYINNNCLRAPAIARSGYFINAMMIAIVRGLRDIWQEKRHGGFEDHYGPEDILLLERVRAADLDVIAVMVCWDLKFKDFPEIWRHMLASRESDIAMIYVNVLERQSMIELGADARVAAFRQWFENEERVGDCDHETLDYMDNLVSCNGGTQFGSRRPTAIGVEILSCLPDRTAYLKGWGQEVMSDPHFSGLKDPINQSHLLQIMSDMHMTFAGGIGFRDQKLARKIFPEGGETLH